MCISCTFAECSWEQREEEPSVLPWEVDLSKGILQLSRSCSDQSELDWCWTQQWHHRAPQG